MNFNKFTFFLILIFSFYSFNIFSQSQEETKEQLEVGKNIKNIIFKVNNSDNDISNNNIINWYPSKSIYSYCSNYIILKDYKGDMYYSTDYATNWLPMKKYQLTDEKNDLFGLKVYPNPSSNYISVELPQQYLLIQFSIYDLTGNLLKSSNIHNTNNLKINLTGFLAGTYTLLINADGNQRTLKFLIIE